MVEIETIYSQFRQNSSLPVETKWGSAVLPINGA
jgi:hypothetical protein